MANHEFISSDVLLDEVISTPEIILREQLTEIIEMASSTIELSASIEARAEHLERLGFKSTDALHVASAEAGNIDFLCTVDDRFVKTSRRLSDLQVRIGNPLELIQEVFP